MTPTTPFSLRGTTAVASLTGKDFGGFPMTRALRSTLPPEMLTAHGTHRFYTDVIGETCSMVDRLATTPEPVFAIEAIYPSGFRSRLHSHDRGQMTFVQTGTMTITGEDYALIVPAGHAMWIPPGHMHLAIATAEISVLSIYADASRLPALPGRCSVLQVSDLFEPLMKRLIAGQLARTRTAVHEALLLLLYEEVRVARLLEVVAPMPRDRRLRRVCEAILQEPTVANGKDQLAQIGNMSNRTMTRLFRAELDMTYSEWVQQALCHCAIGRLSDGQPVSQVAADLGYASPSAFTAMFRRRFGICPSSVGHTRRKR